MNVWYPQRWPLSFLIVTLPWTTWTDWLVWWNDPLSCVISKVQPHRRGQNPLLHKEKKKKKSFCGVSCTGYTGVSEHCEASGFTQKSEEVMSWMAEGSPSPATVILSWMESLFSQEREGVIYHGCKCAFCENALFLNVAILRGLAMLLHFQSSRGENPPLSFVSARR